MAVWELQQTGEIPINQSTRPPSGGSGPGSRPPSSRPPFRPNSSRPPGARPPPRPPRPITTGRNDPRFQRTVDDGPRMNDQIRVEKVRVIDENGEMLGVMTVREGITMAEEAGLDLVEVSPNADPPVCKILDHGKYKYEQQKKAAEARKKQKIIELKEIKIRPGIEKHDYEVKMRNAKRFLEEGDKVKVTMRFRGREMAHQNIGMDVLKRVKEDLAPVSKVEQEPRFEGRQIMMILGPLAPKV